MAGIGQRTKREQKKTRTIRNTIGLHHVIPMRNIKLNRVIFIHLGLCGTLGGRFLGFRSNIRTLRVIQSHREEEQK